MIGVEVHFLAGRFHGNAWHHAHNEGVAEWPPSPWRVLRALVASAYDVGVEMETVAPVLEKLRSLPSYRLPAAREAHTRHYMPGAADKKTKVFDTFVVVDGGVDAPEPVTIVWAVKLAADERALLERLASRVAYLGRAESWAELKVVDVEGDHFDCWPDEHGHSTATTTLMAPESHEALLAWSELQPRPAKKHAADIPRSLWEVLTFSGDRFRDEGWTRVPGSRLSRYVFAEPPFRRASGEPAGVRRRTKRGRPTVAHFAIRANVLPRLTHALSLGERVRTALMSRSAAISGDATPVFSGHASPPLDHGHAFYLSGGDARGHVSHLVVAAKMGFDDVDVRALQSLRRVWDAAVTTSIWC